MKSSVTLDHIVEELEQHQQALRVKKLMFYVCKKRWENDPTQLDSISLKSLVEELREQNSNIESLRDSMNRMVETLNRPGTYAAIANLIITNFTDLYNDSDDTTQIVILQPQTPAQSSVPEVILDEVARSLEHHRDSDRLKKLIFYACKQQWENSLEVLSEYEMSDLVRELRQKNSSLEQLKTNLINIVGTLNRQSVYSYISNLIIQEFEALYKTYEESTQLLARKPSQNLSSSLDDEDEITAVTRTPQVVKPKIESESVVSKKQVATDQNKGYQPFAVKLEIMRKTNPLRAKIVLFSIFYHPFDPTGQDWSVLRTCELDELLSELYHQSETLVDVESRLATAVKSLVDAETKASAQAIINALKPFYPKN